MVNDTGHMSKIFKIIVPNNKFPGDSSQEKRVRVHRFRIQRFSVQRFWVQKFKDPKPCIRGFAGKYLLRGPWEDVPTPVTLE
jgi:hypothetical protein